MKNLKVIFFMLGIALSLQSYAQKPGAEFTDGDKGFFYLRTVRHGDKLSLESNGALSPFKDGSAFMSAQKRASGTMWQFVPVAGHDGWYHMKSKGAGSGKCLEANNPVNGSAKGGSSFMDNCSNVSGQFWQLELVSDEDSDDNIYRIRSYAHGDARCLEGNSPDGSRSGITFMDTTQDVTGQKWRLVRVK